MYAALITGKKTVGFRGGERNHRSGTGARQPELVMAGSGSINMGPHGHIKPWG